MCHVGLYQESLHDARPTKYKIPQNVAGAYEVRGKIKLGSVDFQSIGYTAI